MNIDSEALRELKDQLSRERTKREHDALEEKNRIYALYPEIEEVDKEISLTALKTAYKITETGRTVEDVAKEMVDTLNRLKAQRKAYLQKYNIPEDYAKPKYSCEECSDTGFKDGKMCICLKKKIAEYVYSKSTISLINKEDTFDVFNLEYYSDNTDPEIGVSPRLAANAVYIACKNFCDNFETERRSLYIYGPTGVGKTFITSCITNELLKKGIAVLYHSAYRLFGFVDDYKFNRVPRDNYKSDYDLIYDADLLIIDDLGTEFINSNSQAVLFDILNTRYQTGKKTIISTNLSLAEIDGVYSERISSRIAGNYITLNLFGEDIRFK